jgi:hypothetical protein|tara:strand:+ start:2054 stop:2164 length:111 start_codon:yes stop_codon:yes gene_type:complete
MIGPALLGLFNGWGHIIDKIEQVYENSLFCRFQAKG